MQVRSAPTEVSDTLFSVRHVSQDQIDEAWDFVKDEIESALNHGLGEYGIEDIKNTLKAGDMQLLVILSDFIHAVCVTEILQFPKYRILTVVTLGGKGIDAWLPALQAELERFARAENCAYVRCFGRAGFERKLTGYGYQLAYRLMSKKL
jgi:hypothetical protein